MKRKKLKPLPALKRKAWRMLSEVVRRKYADGNGWVRCYCCGKAMIWNGGEAQAAHFVGGRTGAVLLNEELLRVACEGCNVWQHGNYQIFTLRMIDELGREKVDELLALKGKTKKWTRTELEDLLNEYEVRLTALRNANTAPHTGHIVSKPEPIIGSEPSSGRTF